MEIIDGDRKTGIICVSRFRGGDGDSLAKCSAFRRVLLNTAFFGARSPQFRAAATSGAIDSIPEKS